MASSEADKSEILFSQTPSGEVVAKVIDPPPSPISINLGERADVLNNLNRRRRGLLNPQLIVSIAGLIGMLDGMERGIGTISITTQTDLWPVVYHATSGIFEILLGVGILGVGLNMNTGRLNRIKLIRDRWVKEKLQEIPLDQEPSLAEVAPCG